MKIFHEMMLTNFFGYLYCTKWTPHNDLSNAVRYALPFLKETHGRLVVISSLSGEIGLPYRSAHCASKFAVTGLFEALRMETSETDFTISIVCPPSVHSLAMYASLIRFALSQEMMTLLKLIDAERKNRLLPRRCLLMYACLLLLLTELHRNVSKSLSRLSIVEYGR